MIAIVNRYHRFLLLLKADTYALLCISAQFIAVEWFKSKSNPDIDFVKFTSIYCSAALVFAVLYFSTGALAASRRLKWLMIVFLLASLTLFAIMVVQIYDLWKGKNVELFSSTIIWFTSFGNRDDSLLVSLFMGLLLGTLIIGVQLYLNFDSNYLDISMSMHLTSVSVKKDRGPVERFTI